MKISHIRNVVSALMIILLTACEEVIEVDLNSTNPALVAEGVIDNGSPAWISLSYTTDYFETEPANIEKDAIVIISDNAGHNETLEYVSNGLYQGKDLIGIKNGKYTITISKNGVEYEASSKLFPPSEIFSVNFEENENTRPGQGETSYSINITFKDDPSSRNYYLFKFLINGAAESNSYYLVDDYSYNNTGEIKYVPLRSSFNLGDEVMIELYSVDEETYIYYTQLNNAGEGMMGSSSTPYTPKSNFGSGVLGYFAAWSKVVYDTIVE